MDGQPDVAGVGERRPAAVNPDSHADVAPVGPRPGAHLPLDRERCLECCRSLFEDREKIVRPRIDLATARPPDCVPVTRAHRDQRGVAVVELRQQRREPSRSIRRK